MNIYCFPRKAVATKLLDLNGEALGLISLCGAACSAPVNSMAEGKCRLFEQLACRWHQPFSLKSAGCATPSVRAILSSRCRAKLLRGPGFFGMPPRYLTTSITG